MIESALFSYGSAGGSGVDLSNVPFVVVDVETTGLSPTTDRVVEVALVRVEGGRPIDEWATLINAGRDPGPTFIHHITAEMISGAPSFGDVAGEILSRLDGAVAVAHNAHFEEDFLGAEFDRLGVAAAPVPALCTLRLARQVLAAPNFQLRSCCAISGVELRDAHTALGDTRATAALLPLLLAQAPPVRFPSGPVRQSQYPRGTRVRTRASGIRKGDDGWIRSLLEKLPYSTSDTDPAYVVAYLAAVGAALADGKLTGVEAKDLGRLAGQAGMGAQQVQALHHRFLDGLRDVALADDVVTAVEYRQLVTAAQLLGEPLYFADLTPPQDAITTPARRAATPKGRRVWCSPSVPPDVHDRLSAGGYAIASNLTRSVVGAVVADADRNGPKAARAVDLGVPLYAIGDVATLLKNADGMSVSAGQLTSSKTAQTSVDADIPLGGAVERVAAEVGPAAVAGSASALEPPGWYLDPSRRWMYRYWSGTFWTEAVSTGDGRTWSDSPNVATSCAPTTDGLVDGRQPHTLVEQVMELQRVSVPAALALTFRCIDAEENNSRRSGHGVAPWFYERAAILLARTDDHAAEIAVLERFARQRHAPGAKPPRLLARLETRRHTGR